MALGSNALNKRLQSVNSDGCFSLRAEVIVFNKPVNKTDQHDTFTSGPRSLNRARRCVIQPD